VLPQSTLYCSKNNDKHVLCISDTLYQFSERGLLCLVMQNEGYPTDNLGKMPHLLSKYLKGFQLDSMRFPIA
jgi:hypothetical protein